MIRVSLFYFHFFSLWKIPIIDWRGFIYALYYLYPTYIASGIFIPNHLYPTPSASGKNTRYTSCTPSYNKRQTFTSIHSMAKTLKKASQNFSVFQPAYYVPILYYATTHSMLLHFLYLFSLRIFPAKSHKILLSTWYHPVYSVLFPPQNMDKSESNNTRYPPFSCPGTLGDEILYGVVRKEFLELAVELCRQGLVMCDDQCRFI